VVVVSRIAVILLVSVVWGTGCVLRSDGDAVLDADPFAPDANALDADTTDAGPLTGGISTLAGRGQHGLVDGDRNVALFDDPVNCLVAPDGQVYVADFNNGAIRHITPEGVVSTLLVQAGFSRPFGMIFDASGNFWVETDRDSTGALTGALWKVNRTTGQAQRVEDGKGRFRGMGLLSDGRLVLADYQEHYLAIYNPANRTFVTLAGLKGTPGFADDFGDRARFNIPYDIVVAPGDVIIVADYGNHRLRQVTLDGEVTTLAGASQSASIDGPLATARFMTPQGLARSAEGAIYVTDPTAKVIRKLENGAVTTIAGDGMAGYVEAVDPMDARFYGIEGIDLTADGRYLYIADGNLGDGSPYHRIRRLDFQFD
jgi:DNA-binding beta-propeller fold protein YncE